MDAFCAGLRWILITTVTCWAYTTPNVITLSNNTTAQNPTGNEPLVDAYQKLREIMYKQLANNYPIPPKFYPYFRNIFASFEPLQIITLDEVLQSISISSGITLTWYDPGVKWNPRDYQGIQSIKLPSSLFWLPHIIIPETAVDDGSLSIPNVVEVFFNGAVFVLIPTITTTMCNLDLTYFPFDKQNCTLAMIESEFYNMTSYNVSLGDMSKYFGTNAAWKLVNHECHPQISTDSDPPFSYVSCHVEISRRSAFYVINLIGPMGMTSLMTLIAFCVPAEGGEKISFIVSMFMSTSVFYNYIINITPRSMEHLPRVNILLVAIAVQIIFATAAIVFVLNRFSNAKKLMMIQERRHIQELDNNCEDIRRKSTSLENGLTNRNMPVGDNRLGDGVKKRQGKSTAARSDVVSDGTRSRKEPNGIPGGLSCDQLEIVFFCVMCVITGLLYFCIFFV